MDTQKEVVAILDEILQLGERASTLAPSSQLLGAIPELDSMAVVAILTAVEDRFGVVIEDDDMDGAVFATVGALVAFVDAKLAG